MHSLVSVRLDLFVASLIFFGASYYLIRKNSRSRRGGDDAVRKKKLKTLGYLLIFPGLLLFLLAALNDEISIDSNIRPFDPVAAAAVQGYVPPVLPQPTRTLLAPKDTWISRQPGTNIAAYPSAPPPSSTAPSAAAPFALAPAMPAISPVAPSAPPPAAVADPSHPLSKAEQLQADLAAVGARIAINPKDAEAYGIRGNLLASKRDWEGAERDFQTMVTLNPESTKAKFNLAEMIFMQKKYDVAKAGFVPLEQDSDFGDLAAYKAFLCDLFGGQMDAAAKELDAFNQVGSNASYYFANVAWSINHRKADDARDWLRSAAHIYPPEKFKLYATTLFQMGYLPLPPATSSN